MITVNGQQVDAAGLTLERYLQSAHYDITRVAAELNGNIVGKSDYAKVTLKEGDTLEVVSFVGGG